MDYFAHILIMVGVYATLAASLALAMGHTGLLSLAHASFFAIGSYAVAILGKRFGVPVTLSACAGVALAIALSCLIAVATNRRTRDQFMLITFAVQAVVYSLANNLVQYTGGPSGIAGVPRLGFLPVHGNVRAAYLVLALLLTGGTILVIRSMTKGASGRVLKAIREDETFAQASGKDIAVVKLIALATGAAIAAIAGALFASYMTFISPAHFTVMESVFIATLVILGGAGSLWGPVLGAVVLVTLPELLRFVGIPSAAAANIRQILYGLALVACMLWRPQGLIGEYAFGREVKQK